MKQETESQKTTYVDEITMLQWTLNTYQYYLLLKTTTMCSLNVDCVVYYVLLCCYLFLKKGKKIERKFEDKYCLFQVLCPPETQSWPHFSISCTMTTVWHACAKKYHVILVLGYPLTKMIWKLWPSATRLSWKRCGCRVLFPSSAITGICTLIHVINKQI